MKNVRYIPIGDSYTIGEGVAKDQNYPSLLTAQLKSEGVDIELLENPAVSGFTTQDALDYEVPQFEETNPTFTTVLLGGNDISERVVRDVFAANFQEILGRVQKKLPDKRKIIVLTIPDFSITPHAKQFVHMGDIAAEIKMFNSIVREEAVKRNLPIVELFELTKEMETDRSLILDDNLHPSAKEYVLWTQEIFPIAKNLLSK